MPLILLSSSSSIVPFSHVKQLFRLNDLNLRRNSLFSGIKNIPVPLKQKPPSTGSKKSVVIKECITGSDNNELFVDDWRSDKEPEETEDMCCPWEGAVVYQRKPTTSHVEYCTTLERLGLGNLSTELSKSSASLMGLRVATKQAGKKDFSLGTPVLISVDVTRKKKHKLRLDGIIRTVITLCCNRCGEPAAEGVFSNFSLLLTEEPIEEAEIINMGVIFGEDKFKTSRHGEEEDYDDELAIDLDDRLYFPPGEKAIDISKHIRDLIHLEITLNALCDPMCKGLCLRCGTNLNTSRCNCSKQKVEVKNYGPLGGLIKQM